MTDSQLMTLALAIIIPLSMLIYSNSRITEAKETLGAEIGELRVEMRAGFDRIEAALGTAIERLEHKLEVHEPEHHRK